MIEKTKIKFSFALFAAINSAANDVNEYLLLSSEIENLLKSRNADLERHIDERYEKLSEKDRSELIESYAYDLYQFQSLFPSMHREFMFITLYNYLEHNLSQINNMISQEIGSRVGVEDMNGRGVRRALLFLEKVAGFCFDEMREEISFILGANALRNCVVHGGGVLPNNATEQVNKFVAQQSALSGRPGETVFFSDGFLEVFANKVKGFFRGIEDQLRKLR